MYGEEHLIKTPEDDCHWQFVHLNQCYMQDYFNIPICLKDCLNYNRSSYQFILFKIQILKSSQALTAANLRN